MGEYSAELTIFDERNGEIVKTLKRIEIEDGVLGDGEIENIEDFISMSVEEYEEEGMDEF